MDSKDLTREQADVLTIRLRKHLAYLVKLKKRMEKQRFPIDDPLYRETVAAYNAMHKLTVRTHYMSCGNPGGR